MPRKYISAHEQRCGPPPRMDAFDKHPPGPGINTLCTEELVTELVTRFKKTNGVEFISLSKLIKVVKLIAVELDKRR